jgi:hypothetical protein
MNSLPDLLEFAQPIYNLLSEIDVSAITNNSENHYRCRGRSPSWPTKAIAVHKLGA